MSADFATSVLATVAEAPAPEAPAEISATLPDTSQSDQTADATVDSPTDSLSQSQPPTTAQIRATLKAFREASPDHGPAAKLLNDGYSRYEAYKSVFPTVDEARNIKTHLETVGGMEGLAAMQQTLASIEETDALLDAGDPKILDQIVEDSPEGFKRLAPHYINRLQKLDPIAYAQALQPHFVRSLIDSNFPAVMDHLSRQVADKPEAQAIVQNIQRWFEEQKSLAERQNADTLNPEREKIASEWQKLNQERQKGLQSDIGHQVDSHIRQELGTRLRPYSAALNALPEAVRLDVARAVITKLAEAIKADKAYQIQNSAMLQARKPDKEKIIALNKAKVTALADNVIAAVAKSYNLAPGAAKPPAKTRPATQSVPSQSTELIKLLKPPSDAEIDWDYPGAQQGYIRGRARIKAGHFAGRFVQWPKG